MAPFLSRTGAWSETQLVQARKHGMGGSAERSISDRDPLQLNSLDWMDRRQARPARLPAGELRRVLANPPSCVDPRGLTIEGAQITGELDLAELAVAFPVAFTACRFEKPISAQEARFRSLDFSKSQLSGADLGQATIDGSLGMIGANLDADADGVALGLVLARIVGGWIATDAAAESNSALHSTATPDELWRRLQSCAN